MFGICPIVSLAFFRTFSFFELRLNLANVQFFNKQRVYEKNFSSIIALFTHSAGLLVALLIKSRIAFMRIF